MLQEKRVRDRVPCYNMEMTESCGDRFVILRHEPPVEGGGRPLHWDLMLEAGDRLLTWALDREPQLGATIGAEKLSVFDTAEIHSKVPAVSGLTTARKLSAIEGFTASLAFELSLFDVRVKLVEPGYGPSTRFTSNSGSRLEGLIPEAYAPPVR